MAHCRLLLTNQPANGALVGTWPAVALSPKPCAEEIPVYLTHYAPASSWEAACLDDILQDKGALPAKNSYLNGTIIRMQNPNLVFGQIHSRLPQDCYFTFSLVTAENVKLSLSRKFNTLIYRLYYPLYLLVSRVMPKLNGLQNIFRILGLVPPMSKAEVLGRLIYKGFSVVDVIEDDCETTLVVKRDAASNPSQTKPVPSQGFIMKMQRLGQYGKPIQVYKFRTMHPYAEYVQAYLHVQNGLDRGGKFKDDFRIIEGGCLIRKYWLDEIPMLYNLLRGDLKLVGIRPISGHYFSLYPASAQAIRTRHKPGLLPPFYADLPQTFDEIVQSELTYLAAYEAAPLATDLRYFGRILMNIFVNKARSK